ncbi:SXL [Symbiodinium natans]|uniref:SXL protein n=1 Tax=Symbiodinium natans TaxID=878477 RepID=A0A812R395_9DINO|nr:SXL [Symbiodinium natans]
MAAPRSGPPSEDLFVTGLPVDCTAVQAKQIFQQYGGVKQANVLPVAAGKTAAAAFVIMESVQDAQWVIDNVNGNVPQGLSSPVTVAFATPRTQRGKGMKGDMKGMPPDMMQMMAMMVAAMGKGGGGDLGKGGGGDWGKGAGGGDWGKGGGGDWGKGGGDWGKGGGDWGKGGGDWGKGGGDWGGYGGGMPGKGWGGGMMW